MNERTRRFLSAVPLCFALLLTGCGMEKTSDATVTPTADSTALRIGVLPTLDCLPAMYAAATGIYDSLGLHVEVVPFTAAMDCDTAFVNSHIDGMFTDLVRSILINEQKKCRIVMSTDAEWLLLGNKKLRLKRLEQVKDRTVVLARHSAADFFSDYVCDKTGIAKDEVHRPQINDVNLRLKMLENNQIDAAFLPQPQARLAQTAGHRVLFASGESKLGFGTCIFSDAFLKSKTGKEQASVFIKGFVVAALRLNNQKSRAISLLTDKMGVPKALADSISLPRYTRHRLPSKQETEAVYSWLQSRNLIAAGRQADSLTLSLNP